MAEKTLEEATTIDEVDDLIQQKINEASQKEKPEFPSFGELMPYIIKKLELQGIQVSLPLPGVAGIPPALESLAKAFIGDEVIEVLKSIENGEEIIKDQIQKIISKIMFLLMIGVTIATAGLVPAPPDMKLVEEYLKLIAKMTAAASSSNADSGNGSDNGSGAASRIIKSTANSSSSSNRNNNTVV